MLKKCFIFHACLSLKCDLKKKNNRTKRGRIDDKRKKKKVKMIESNEAININFSNQDTSI